MSSYQHHSQSFAWKASSFQSSSDYTVTLTDADRKEVIDVVRALPAGVPLHECAVELMQLPTLGPRLSAAYEDVRNGRGFVVLRGLPTDGISTDEFVAAQWVVGLYFGDPLSQNTDGDYIGHMMDASTIEATPRMYRSNLELRPHSDITAMITLAYSHKSMRGGASVVASAVTVHDQIRETAPEHLPYLYQGFHYHLLGEEAQGRAPVTEQRIPLFAVRDGQLSSRYLRSNLVAGHKELNIPLTDAEIAALNYFDQVATSPENRLAFFLERGDMVVINNYTVMHARTSFENYPEPERARHLVRLWLDQPGFRNVPETYNFHDVNGVPRQEGKRANLDFKRLYADDPVALGGVPDLKVSDDLAARSR